jgi:hypothetical protein
LPGCHVDLFRREESGKDRQNNNGRIWLGGTQRERGRESFSGNDEPYGRRFIGTPEREEIVGFLQGTVELSGFVIEDGVDLTQDGRIW